MKDRNLYNAIKSRFGKEKALSCWMALTDCKASELANQAGITAHAVRLYLRGKMKSEKIDKAASSLFGFEV